MPQITNAEAKIVKAIKTAWLDASDAAKDEVAKLIVGERGFLKNNAELLLAVNAAACFALGWFARAIF